MAVITISRTPGSQGALLGEEVGRRLGYRLVDRHELVRLAAYVGGPEAWDRTPELRERSPSFWERLNEERRRYASVLRTVVLDLAQQDNVVIVGLGAGQLLRSLHYVLRVQVVATLEDRISRLMERGYDDVHGPLTRERARELMKQRDRDAAGYMRYLFNIDWLDAVHWDLVVNTSRFSIQDGAEIIVLMVQQGLVSKTHDDEQRMADLAVASKVEAALLNQANVWVNSLKVRARDGHVQLEGEVIGEEDREAAEQVALGIEGVRTVQNDLRIQPPPLTGM